MDIKEALDRLRQYLDEIVHLKTLHYSDKERWLWKNKVNVVLEAAFGKDSSEYKEVNSSVLIDWGPKTDGEKQRDYLSDLDWDELGIKKILQKYEIVGIANSGVAVKSEAEHPKAFISHGKESDALTKLREFLTAIGIEPLIVKDKPSIGMAVDDKVEHYLEQPDCAIILATGDDEIDGKLYPRQNVSHEIGLAQKTIPNKIVYLLEKGAEFPSNISPKVWESCTKDRIEDTFTAIVRELKAFGIIKAVKPQ